MSTLDYSLYLATDASFFPSSPEDENFFSILESCLAGGVSVLQLRLKGVSARYYYEIGLRVRELTRKLQVPLIINDRVDLALALGADGVHVGRSDLPPEVVRKVLPKGIIGYSVNTFEHLAYAEGAGVDYVGVGPVFATSTKRDTGPVLGLAGLHRIVTRARIPCVAIGGISIHNAGRAIRAGSSGVCVISSVFKADEPHFVVRQLRQCIDAECCGDRKY